MLLRLYAQDYGIKMGIIDWFRKKKHRKVDVDKDLRAVALFLDEVSFDIKKIKTLLDHMISLRHKEKELLAKHAPAESLRFNTEKQAQVWDKLMEAYEYFDEDVDINGERIKLIAHDLKKKAKRRHISRQMLDRMEGKVEGVEWWTFNW